MCAYLENKRRLTMATRRRWQTMGVRGLTEHAGRHHGRTAHQGDFREVVPVELTLSGE